MKKLFSILFTVLLCCGIASAQSNTDFPPMDKSPMDMSYYPTNYPSLKIQNKVNEPLAARIIYSRPQKNGRTIFGGLVEYGKVWRLGANEATEIEFFKHVRIGDKKILKGRYTLYAIVYEDKWTIILNKETDIWGAFKYDAKKDVVRVDVPVQKTSDPLESLTMVFEKSMQGFGIVIGWDNIKVSLPVVL